MKRHRSHSVDPGGVEQRPPPRDFERAQEQGPRGRGGKVARAGSARRPEGLPQVCAAEATLDGDSGDEEKRARGRRRPKDGKPAVDDGGERRGGGAACRGGAARGPGEPGQRAPPGRRRPEPLGGQRGAGEAPTTTASRRWRWWRLASSTAASSGRDDGARTAARPARLTGPRAPAAELDAPTRDPRRGPRARDGGAQARGLLAVGGGDGRRSPRRRGRSGRGVPAKGRAQPSSSGNDTSADERGFHAAGVTTTTGEDTSDVGGTSTAFTTFRCEDKQTFLLCDGVNDPGANSRAY